jgi:DNA-directed RNA polymerase specialized sigma24 family protein
MEGMRQSGIGIQELLAHADWLRRLATHLVHDRDAEDLTQDTWSAALQSPPGSGWPAEPWLATVLRNVARRRWRAERLHERARPDLEGCSAFKTETAFAGAAPNRPR